MRDASHNCAACRWPLAADDLFCSRCGTPTPINVDPEATLINPAGWGGADDAAAGGEAQAGEATAPSEAPAPARTSSGDVFKARLRHVLGAEYELLGMIGQGGFARVYKAKDRRLGRQVAIKVIHPDVIGNKVFVESFRNEGVALAKLRHPGIVPIYDIRERGGLIYYVMPFVEGTTLERRMKRARLPPFESRRILSELAEALAAAHRAQMVHLDIKPTNVFLEGDLQKVLLMDFGIARALTDQVEEKSAGPVVGTPEYMSPEQARGLPDIDHRSDIYSLGALGYCMLVGRPPVRGANDRDTLAKHVSEAPVALRSINPSIPKDFAEAIMRCLNKDPWDRFATAMDLRGALESVTFFTGGAEGGRGASGVQVTVVVLIASIAVLIGLLAGLALR
jgi:serine/threonine-protein kinase